MFLDRHKVEMRNVAAIDQITVEIGDRSSGTIRSSQMYREYSKSTERTARRSCLARQNEIACKDRDKLNN